MPFGVPTFCPWPSRGSGACARSRWRTCSTIVREQVALSERGAIAATGAVAAPWPRGLSAAPPLPGRAATLIELIAVVKLLETSTRPEAMDRGCVRRWGR
jgi:hypothetical protein